MSFRRCVSCWLRIVAQPSSILSAAKIFDDADAGEVSSHFRNWNYCWTVVTTRMMPNADSFTRRRETPTTRDARMLVPYRPPIRYSDDPSQTRQVASDKVPIVSVSR